MYSVHMITMKYICLVAAIWGGAALTSQAQQAVPDTATRNMSLADCINYAYVHQDSVKNAILDVKSAEYKVKETIGTGLPQVNGTAAFQYYFTPPPSVGPNFAALTSGKPFDPNQPLVKYPFGATNYSNNYTLQATQLLFSGTYIVGLQAVKTFKELSQRSLTRTKIQTSVAIQKAYYAVLVSYEQTKLQDANLAQLKEQLSQTVQQNKQGFVEKIDVDRLQVQYDNLVTTRENTVRSTEMYMQMLKFQMGMPIYQNIVLTDKLENVDFTNNLAEYATDTTFYRTRIEYNLAETNLRLNELNAKSKRAEYLPSLTANGGYGEVFEENHFRYLYDHAYNQSYIGLNLNVPIFNGNQRHFQLKQLNITTEKSMNDLANAKNALSLQASQSRIMYYNNLQSLKNQKYNETLAQEVLHVARVKYQQGVGSSIEVTQAETDLQSADNQYIQALYNLLVGKVDLEQAYGRIQ